MSARFDTGTPVVVAVAGLDARFGFDQPQPGRVFEDYGMPHVGVKLDNGQLHAVPREYVTEVK